MRASGPAAGRRARSHWRGDDLEGDMMSQSAAAREPVTAAVTPVTVELVDRHGRGTVVEIELRYLAEDPWAVSIAVPTTIGPVVWCFARDLLEHGVFTPAGDGDVHVWPSLSAS